MNQQEITEGNRLIAEFMGFKPDESDRFFLTKQFERFYEYDTGHFRAQTTFYGPELIFHTSWDWLMPVVEKIQGIDPEMNGYEFILYKNDTVLCIFDGTGIYHSKTTSDKITGTWEVVVKFIEWYNKEYAEAKKEYQAHTEDHFTSQRHQ